MGVEFPWRLVTASARRSGGVLSVRQALQLVNGEFNDEFFAGGDVRIGDIVLLVDSDTRIPEDCLSKTCGESSTFQLGDACFPCPSCGSGLFPTRCGSMMEAHDGGR